MTTDLNQSPEAIAEMTQAERETRVLALIEDGHRIIKEALDTHLDDHQLVGTCILYSGGNDSTTLAHLFKDQATHAIHCNTTIGIEQTRQFVRDVCKNWGLPLMEEVAPITYRELVIEQGFPGPGHHFKMYQRLKERGLRQARGKLVKNPREERVLFLAGRRKAESKRRAGIPEYEREGSIIWASPLANWEKLDLNTYRQMFPDVPRNEVSDLLHMSGECLCGSFAKPGELEEIRYWFPDVAKEIDALEKEVAAAGHPEEKCKWGHRKGVRSKVGMMCSGCEALFEIEDQK